MVSCRFAAVNLGKGDGNPDYPAIVSALAANDKPRVDFMKACLSKLGLKVNEDSAQAPSLSRLHLTSREPQTVAAMAKTLLEQTIAEDGKQLLKGENDTFNIEREGSTWSLTDIKQALPTAVQNLVDQATQLTFSGEQATQPEVAQEAALDEAGIVDFDKIVKTLLLHDKSLPEARSTPYFNHNAFFANLDHYNKIARNSSRTFGETLLYGEVVTSTNTLLDK